MPSDRTAEEDDLLRLLGETAGRRVLELGLGDGARAVTLAGRGATVIGVDVDEGAVRAAAVAAAAAEVRVEVHRVDDLADLAFLRADSVDAALAVDALAAHPDLARVCRQVHRVLRAGGCFLLTLPHPLACCLGPDPQGPAERVVPMRSYFDTTPLHRPGPGGVAPVVRPRTFAEVFTTLRSTGFRLDHLVELPAATDPPSGGPVLPELVVWRARKEGA